MKKFKAVFYKSRGRWTGPYLGELYTKKQFSQYLKGLFPDDKLVLKSKVSFRTVLAKHVVSHGSHYTLANKS